MCAAVWPSSLFALAPDLYARQGDVSRLTSIQQIVSEVVSKVPDAQVMADLDAAVAFAQATGKADTAASASPLLLGGRIVWLYARIMRV